MKNFKPGTRKVPGHFGKKKGSGRARGEERREARAAAAAAAAEAAAAAAAVSHLSSPLSLSPAAPREASRAERGRKPREALRGRTTCLADKTNHPVKRAESQ